MAGNVANAKKVKGVSLASGTRYRSVPGDENFAANVATVKDQRARMVGERFAMRPEAGSVIGRLFLNRAISEAQYRAGVQMEALAQLMRMAKGWPLDRVRALVLERLGRGGTADAERFTQGEVRAIQRRYDRMVVALDAAGDAARLVTVAAVMRDEPVTDQTLFALKTGLTAMAQHFNAGGKGVSPNRVLTWSESGRATLDPLMWKNPQARVGD